MGARNASRDGLGGRFNGVDHVNQGRFVAAAAAPILDNTTATSRHHPALKRSKLGQVGARAEIAVAAREDNRRDVGIRLALRDLVENVAAEPPTERVELVGSADGAEVDNVHHHDNIYYSLLLCVADTENT